MSSDQSPSPNAVTPDTPADRAVPTVLIASQDVVAAWSQQVTAPADLIAIADTDAHHAVDIITRTHPRVVVVEQAFAATTRGMTLVNALRSNPTLDGYGSCVWWVGGPSPRSTPATIRSGSL